MIAPRRMFLLCALGLGAVGLGGCSQEAPQPTISEEAAALDTAAQAGGVGVKSLPGRWQTQLRMMDFDMPDMPPEIKRTVARQMGKATDVAICLTPEDAARTDGQLFQPRGKDCKYQNFSMANGQIAAKLLCSKGGGEQVMEMRGTYGAESYDITINSQGDLNGAAVNMTMHMTGIRTGECAGDENE